MLSVTDVAFRVSKWISMLVGALQVTGDRGPVNVTIRTPLAAVVGGAVEGETAEDELGMAVEDVTPALAAVVEEVGGTVVVGEPGLWELEQPARTTTAPIVTIRTARVEGMARS